MKKIIFIIAVFVAVSLSASAKIQDTFLGVQLGKSSSADVKRELKSRGFFNISKDKDNPEYLGEYKHLGVKFYVIRPSFLKDTLADITFCVEADKDKYDKVCKSIHSKYKKHSALDSTMLQIFLSHEGPYNEGVGRMDSETQVLCALTDSLLLCKYVAYGYSTRKVIETLQEFKDLDVVHGFAGVKFGDPWYSVISSMRRRTTHEAFDITDREVSYLLINIGGRVFDIATLYFAKGKGLAAATMYKAFELDDKERAIECYNDICFQYRNKYTNFVSLDREDPDDQMSVCGRVDENVADENCTFPIWISMKKQQNKSGKYMYYVKVDYYITNTLNLYKEDI